MCKSGGNAIPAVQTKTPLTGSRIPAPKARNCGYPAATCAEPTQFKDKQVQRDSPGGAPLHDPDGDSVIGQEGHDGTRTQVAGTNRRPSRKDWRCGDGSVSLGSSVEGGTHDRTARTAAGLVSGSVRRARLAVLRRAGMDDCCACWLPAATLPCDGQSDATITTWRAGHQRQPARRDRRRGNGCGRRYRDRVGLQVKRAASGRRRVRRCTLHVNLTCSSRVAEGKPNS